MSAAGQNNVTNNRGHGSGSGMSYRAPHDMVNDPSVAQNNRGHGIGSGIGYRAPDTSNKVKLIAFHYIILQWRQPH